MWGLRHVAVILVCECVFPQIVQILSKVPEVLGNSGFSLGEQDISTKGRFAAPNEKLCAQGVLCAKQKWGHAQLHR